MNKTMNSASPKPLDAKRPDVAAALDELENSVTTLEELVGTLTVKLSPVCSDQDPEGGMPNEIAQSLCQVSGNVRELDKRACVLICRLRYLLSGLEV